MTLGPGSAPETRHRSRLTAGAPRRDHHQTHRRVDHPSSPQLPHERKLNRTENLPPIPPGDPDFADLFRTRNDAESINRNLDDMPFLRRAHSAGARRQLVNMLG
jgi:hypothetical protein